MADRPITDEPEVNIALSGEAGQPIEVTVPAEAAVLPVVRAVLESVLLLDDWTIDEIADVKLGVDEICSQIIEMRAVGARLSVSVSVSSFGELSGRIDGVLAPEGSLDTEGFGWHVVRTVIDVGHISRDVVSDGIRVIVPFVKRHDQRHR